MIAQKVIIHNLCLAQHEERPKMCNIDEFKHSCSSMAKYHCTRKSWVLKARLKQNTNLASECWNLLNPKLLIVDGTALNFFQTSCVSPITSMALLLSKAFSS